VPTGPFTADPFGLAPTEERLRTRPATPLEQLTYGNPGGKPGTIIPGYEGSGLNQNVFLTLNVFLPDVLGAGATPYRNIALHPLPVGTPSLADQAAAELAVDALQIVAGYAAGELAAVGDVAAVGSAGETTAGETIEGTALRGGGWYPPNPDGAVRSLEEAKAIAEAAGINTDNFTIKVVETLPDDVGARFGSWTVPGGKAGDAVILKRSDLYTADGTWGIELNAQVLDSDENIVWVLGHEQDELLAIEQEFSQNGNVMSMKQFRQLSGTTGSAHQNAMNSATARVTAHFGK
jgi:hypothetical protein